MWFMCSLRPAGSTPCLPFGRLRALSLSKRLPTPPRGDAVGTVCGAEPSNCTDGTFTRADARFTGAPSDKIWPRAVARLQKLVAAHSAQRTATNWQKDLEAVAREPRVKWKKNARRILLCRENVNTAVVTFFDVFLRVVPSATGAGHCGT